MIISNLIQLAYHLISFTLLSLNTVFELDYFGLIPKVVILVENERLGRHQPHAHIRKKPPCKYFFYANHFQFLNERKINFYSNHALTSNYIYYAILKAKTKRRIT